VRDEPICENCGEDTAFWIFDDCKACTAAVIVANPDAWNSNRRFYVGTAECAELDREIARQRAALSCAEVAA
jgi:hypothetical protein